MNYCCRCGGRVSRSIPAGDNRLRDICNACGAVHYVNPLMVVGTLPVYKDEILLCLRDIEPAKNRWTLPAGFLEMGETLAHGAARETLEETGARPVNLRPYRAYDICHIGQIYFIFLADLEEPTFYPTAESRKVSLFAPGQIPWREIAFPVIHRVLSDYVEDSGRDNRPFALAEITEKMDDWIAEISD